MCSASMKGSLDTEVVIPEALALYARACGWTLARAHARTGDPVAIAAKIKATIAPSSQKVKTAEIVQPAAPPQRLGLAELKGGGAAAQVTGGVNLTESEPYLLKRPVMQDVRG
jgi:hypothetical protein